MRAPAATLFSLVVLASTANAQFGSVVDGLTTGLGVNCIGGLASLLGNQELSNCLKIGDAVSDIGAVGKNESVIPALNTYLSKSLCPADVCSNATLAQANSTIGSACSSEIASNSNFLPGLLQLILSYYTDVKTGSCLADSRNNSQLCVAETLTNVQSALGQNLTLTEIQTLGSDTDASSQFLQQLNQANSTEFCTDCNKGIFATLSPALTAYLRNETLSSFEQAITRGCGQDFLTAGVPNTLTQTGKLNSSSESGSSGSSSGGANNGFTLQAASPIVAATLLIAAGFANLA